MVQLIFNILISFFLYLLIATSFSLIYYPTKIFHIAHAVIITLGAYLVFFFVSKFSLSIILSVPLSIIFAMLAGLLIEILIYRRMRDRKLPSLLFLIASIGIYIILQNCISLFWGDYAKNINPNEISVGNNFFGAYITNLQILIIVLSLILFLLVRLFLSYTTFGKSLRAVSSNPELCNIYGISSNKIILFAFGIGSSLAATAGILSAMDTNMTPTFGFNLLLYGLVAMIIGGVGSTKGLIAGALLVATAQHLAAYYIDTKWMDAVTYIILISFLIWKPLGFSGKQLKKVEV
jgi:branched-chain amino acid transport system permease protein